jgi:hypothetical protein
LMIAMALAGNTPAIGRIDALHLINFLRSIIVLF